jgi:hypothetical protein
MGEKTMNKKMMSAGLAAALGLFAAGARAAQTAAERAVSGWPEAGRQAAQALMEKYGEPDWSSSARIEWLHRGSFKRIAVNAAPGALGIIENTIGYEVPAGGIGLLSLQDCAVVPDKGAAELTAFSGREDLNLLGLNVADEVMHGKLDVAQARELQARTLGPRDSGKSSPYQEKLLFKAGTDPLYDYVHNTSD